MFADATVICTCVAESPLNAMLRAISSDTRYLPSARAWSGPNIGTVGRRLHDAAARGAIGRDAGDLLANRLHDRLDPAVAGLDRRAQPQHVLVHRRTQSQD